MGPKICNFFDLVLATTQLTWLNIKLVQWLWQFDVPLNKVHTLEVANNEIYEQTLKKNIKKNKESRHTTAFNGKIVCASEHSIYMIIRGIMLTQLNLLKPMGFIAPVFKHWSKAVLIGFIGLLRPLAPRSTAKCVCLMPYQLFGSAVASARNKDQL